MGHWVKDKEEDERRRGRWDNMGKYGGKKEERESKRIWMKERGEGGE